MSSDTQVVIPNTVAETDSILLADPTDSHFSVSIPYQQQPERRLVAAVFENGIHQFQINVSQRSRTQYNQFREAYNWIFTQDFYFIFSFDNCCHFLDLDPDYIRTHLRRYLNRVGYVDATNFYKQRTVRKRSK